MIELGMIRDLVAIFGVIAGFTYYVMTVRNSQRTQQLQLETRQAQLFMALYETHRSQEFRKQYTRVRDREWKDFSDWQSRYGPENDPDASAEYQSLMSFFDGVGLLVRRELVDISLVHDLMFISTTRIWNKHNSVINYIRERTGQSSLWVHFEHLNNELIKYHEEHPELKP